MLSDCSFIWNTGPVNIWNVRTAQCILYVGPVIFFLLKLKKNWIIYFLMNKLVCIAIPDTAHLKTCSHDLRFTARWCDQVDRVSPTSFRVMLYVCMYLSLLDTSTGYSPQFYDADQVPVPLTMFRSNLKFDQNLQCSGLKHTPPITTKCCTRHDSVTVVTYTKCRCDRLNMIWTRTFQIFIELEFDRNIVSGTGAVHRRRVAVPVKRKWRKGNALELVR